MHVDEIDIDEALVHRLLREQFPEWSELPLSRVQPQGTVNAIFRLGEKLSVRLARRGGPIEPGGKEFRWLPRLAPLLPVAEIDAIQAARDLAELIDALQSMSPTGAPPGRGIPLAERDLEIRYWLRRFDGDPGVPEAWERALAAPPWDGPPVWHHGDLDARNWLVRDGRISGVIDWGSMGVGDPACDVMVAWKLHSASARDAFRDAFSVETSIWERTRGWALSQAVAILAYYTPETNATLHHEAERWLQLLLSEHDER